MQGAPAQLQTAMASMLVLLLSASGGSVASPDDSGTAERVNATLAGVDLFFLDRTAVTVIANPSVRTAQWKDGICIQGFLKCCGQVGGAGNATDSFAYAPPGGCASGDRAHCRIKAVFKAPTLVAADSHRV